MVNKSLFPRNFGTHKYPLFMASLYPETLWEHIMVRMRDIRKFPRQWMEFFEFLMANSQDEHVVPCETKKDADNFRLEFYRAHKALQYDEVVYEKKYKSLLNWEVKVHAGGGNPKGYVDGEWVCVFSPKDKRKTAMLIEQSLKRWRRE